MTRPRGPLGRAVLALVLLLLAWPALSSCRRPPPAPLRVIVLGFDGLDYELTRDLMAAGRLPNFSRLAEGGGFSSLGTSVPPQSPVAWSTFITGLDPGSHGIYDFIHRDPATLLPYLSTTMTEPPGRTLSVGRWQLPLSGGSLRLLRQGTPFWDALEARGVPAAVVRMPANFPPSGTASRELSGMGTPDLLGTYGTFSFYTSEPFAFRGQPVSGGTIHRVHVANDVVSATLYGPDNPLLATPEKTRVDFTVYVDARQPLAKIAIGGEERLLKVGEWSDWVPVDLPLMPLQSIAGMCRFYLKQVRPYFELYVSPLNLDPMAPALPISTPGSYAERLARQTGRFYTQGMPEDTQGLRSGVLSRDEFLAQARLAGDEVREQYWPILEEFGEGLLFYYFGNVDQIGHVMWRPMDAAHPAYDAQADDPYREVLAELYADLDEVVGRTMARMGEETLLVVMSDHGFTSWRRAFHLNSWLEQHGYLTVRDPARRDLTGFANVDWTRTRAYGLGLNGLYINLQGRERFGIVAPEAREALAGEIASRLLDTTDPATGGPAVTKVYRREEVYREVRQPEIAPDLIVGYARGTRGSDQSALGEVPADVIVDNLDPWSGDHCMDHEAVPGVLLASRPLRRPAPSLQDLAGAILAEFGIEDFPAR